MSAYDEHWGLDDGLDRGWSRVSILLQESSKVTAIVDEFDGTGYKDVWRDGVEIAEELYRVYRQFDLDQPSIEYRQDQQQYIVDATYTDTDGVVGSIHLVGRLDDDFVSDLDA